MTLTTTDTAAAPTGTPHVQVLIDRCAGCQECVIRCPTHSLSMDTGRWVATADDELCVGCRQCMRTCPFSAIVVTGPMVVEPRVTAVQQHPERVLGDISEIRQGFTSWDEALLEASRCLQCPDPTCVRGCPAHNDIPGFIAAIRERDLPGAHEVLRRTTVLPDVCSRVCNQAAQCEGACSWSLAGGVPVAIGRLERFVTDQMPVPPARRVDPATTPELDVAIVGAGPAAAGAAWELIEAGATVTVLEKDATPGGLTSWGIPDFTLPHEVAQRPWQQLTEAGVELRCGHEVHAGDIPDLLAKHDAVILAHGAGVPLRLPVPGADLEGIVDATTFLQGGKTALEHGGETAAFLASLGLDAATVHDVDVPQVLVLGAGNTAMDVARTARRLGLAATCVDWLDERFALARPDELDEARHEGVEVRFSRTLTALAGTTGRVSTARLAHTRQDRADRRPKVLEHTYEELAVDLVVMAMGYRGDPEFAALLPGTPVRRESAGVPDRRWQASGILANPASSYANNSPVGRLAAGREVGLWTATLPVSERLWAVGDALIGPATVVEAMAAGRRAAAAILQAHPARPSRGVGASSREQHRVLVGYASAGGTTARAAQAVADGLSQRGALVRTLPVDKIGLAELAAADVLVLGSWVEGLVVAGVRPAKQMRAWLERMPRLGAKPVATFVTFRVAPKGSLAAMRRAVEDRGGHVVAEAAYGPRELKASGDAVEVGALVDALLEATNRSLTRVGG